MSTPGFVYLLASQHSGILYVGVTSNLLRRIAEHKTGAAEGFTRRYRVHHLVHYEAFDDIRQAILREKRLKAWRRAWKVDLIEQHNPYWRDLYPSLLDSAGAMLADGSPRSRR